MPAPACTRSNTLGLKARPMTALWFRLRLPALRFHSIFLSRARLLTELPPPLLITVDSRRCHRSSPIQYSHSTTTSHRCSPARSISSSRIRASFSTAPACTSSAAVSCLPWAAHSKPIRTTTTPQSAPPRPREALRPLHWLPSATHRLPDTRRRLPPPPSSLLPPVAPNPKLMFPIDCTNTFPTTHWSLCPGPSPTSAAGASPSSLTPPPPVRAPVEVPLSGHLYPRHVAQSNRREPLKLSLPSDLAAGDPPHRNTAV
jgi:hypothetical protein